MITINPQAADVIAININDADQIQLNTTAIVIASDGDADTLQGEDGAYYLDRDNHTGTQAISTISGLQDALDLKLDPASLSDAGAILPTDQLVIYRNGVPLRTTVAQLGLAPTPPSVDLLLMPTGATESADGVFQRFVPNATDPLGYPAYYAELDVADWQESPISVQFKWPDLTVVYDTLVIFFSGGNFNSIENPVGNETDSIWASLQLARTDDGGQVEPYNYGVFDFYKFGVEPPTSEPLTLTPSAGDIATLTFTRTQITLTVGGETQTYAIPVGIFTGVPLLNVAAKVRSAVLPLSIKVLHTE